MPLVAVVFDSTGAGSFTLPRESQRKFFRAVPFHAVNEVCNNHLKAVRFAQLLAAYDTLASADIPITTDELEPYLKINIVPFCPLGYETITTTVLSNPCCTGHPFEEP